MPLSLTHCARQSPAVGAGKAEAVVLNAAVALTLVGEPLETGARRATEALDSGAADDLLDRWIAWA